MPSKILCIWLSCKRLLSWHDKDRASAKSASAPISCLTLQGCSALVLAATLLALTHLGSGYVLFQSVLLGSCLKQKKAAPVFRSMG